MRVFTAVLFGLISSQAFAQFAPKSQPVQPTPQQLELKDQNNAALRETHVWVLNTLLAKQKDAKLNLQKLLLKQKPDASTQDLNYALTTCVNQASNYDLMTILDPQAVKTSGLPEFLGIENCLKPD